MTQLRQWASLHVAPKNLGRRPSFSKGGRSFFADLIPAKCKLLAYALNEFGVDTNETCSDVSNNCCFPFDVARAVSGSGFDIINCRYVEADDFARKELATGKTAATYGEHPTGYADDTGGGHFLIFGVAQDRKKNEKVAAPTDAERVELFKSMFAWGGN